MTDIQLVLQRLGLHQYYDIFRTEGFDTWETVMDIQENDLEVQNTFFEYCAEHWTSHLNENIVIEDRKVLDRVLLLYATNTDLFHAWFPILWKAIHSYERTPEVQIQHVVSMSDHSSVLDEIFHRARFELEALDSTCRTALHWAAERGHHSVVNWLIQLGADVNAGGEYGSPLHAASEGGHEKVVQMLLDAGADVNAQGGPYDNALQAALFGGREKLIEVVLKFGNKLTADAHLL